MDKAGQEEMEPPPRNILLAKKILVERFTNTAADCALREVRVGLRGAILSGVMLSACAAGAFGAPPEVIAPFPGGGADPDTGSPAVALDIKPQSVAEALTDWAQQTGLQVIVPAGPQTDRLLVTRIKGKLTARNALEQVLANTELTYEFINARTVVIRERPRVETKVTQGSARDASVGEGASQEKQRSAPSYNDMLLASVTLGEEVIVAGSHIRGTLSAGSRVQILDEGDIAATGYATVQDVLRTIPSNLGGGPSEDFDDGISGNFNRGIGINLRRLGAGATLVLVNGRRQPVSGATGTYVDISNIPVSAVSRIEVLTDGASAVYGSDAIGGVVNIVLRYDYDGAETQADYAVAGDPRERRLSQVVGRAWDGGNALVGYQFYDREALPQSAEAYSASEDKRPFGGDDFRLFMSNPGTILNPLTGLPAYAIPAGQDGTSLQPMDLLPGAVNLQGVQDAADLLPQQRMHSAYFNVRQRIGEDLTLHADGRYSRREIDNRISALPMILAVPAANPFFVDPFGGSPMVLVAYNFLDDLGPITGKGHTSTFSTTADATLRFARTWNTRLAATYGQENLQWRAENGVDLAALNVALADPNPATAFNPFGDGSHTNPATLAAIRAGQDERAISALQDLTLTADGALVDLPGGAAKLAVGVDYREESLDSRSTDFVRLNRSILAGFAEVALPVVGKNNALPGMHELELSFAGRYEQYSDFGNTLNPRLGVSWAPLDAVRVRGNWGTSFKAPSLIDGYITSTSSSINVTSVADPMSATGRSTVLLRQGRNTQLQNETAEVWNAGLDFLWPGEVTPTLSLTYFDIDFRDRIAEGGPPGAALNILLQEAQWAELIQRDPTRQQVEALCGSAEFIGNPASCAATSIAAVVDIRRRNLGRVRVQGIDLSFARPISTSSWGEFGLSLEASYVLRYQIAANRHAQLLDIVDTTGNALALRLRGALSWQRNQWSANLFANYTDDYTDDLSRPQRDIASWTTVDMRLAYQLPAHARWLGDLELSISAVNAFDKDPPFNNSRIGYDRANADPIGRAISVRITKWW
jgi:iron complex outermembrane receptor protein